MKSIHLVFIKIVILIFVFFTSFIHSFEVNTTPSILITEKTVYTKTVESRSANFKQMAPSFNTTTQTKQSNMEITNLGIFLGVMTASAFAFFVLFIFTKELTFLFITGFITPLTIICLSFPASNALTNLPFIQQSLFIISVCLTIIFSLCIAIKSLKSLFDSERLIKVLYGLIAASSVLMPLMFLLKPVWLVYALSLIIIMVCISHVYTTYIHWQQNSYEYAHYAVAIAFIIFSLVLICLTNSFDLTLLVTNEQILQLGTLAFTVVISGSMLYKLSKHHNSFGDLDVDNVEEDKDLQLSEQMMELQFAMRELQEKNEQLEKLNTTDDLSGIYNRRHFDKRLLSELRRARREMNPLSLIIFDIDHFKKVNDNYGHIIGDEVIRSVAFHASNSLNRITDEIFRYGGEEFTVLLPHTDLEGASILAENIRTTIEQLTITSHEQTLSCTVSLGVATHLSEKSISPDEFIAFADKALYEAKQNGRNLVRQHKEEVLLSGS